MFNFFKAASDTDKLLYALQANTSQTGADIKSLVEDIEELDTLVSALVKKSMAGELDPSWAADLRQLQAFIDMAKKNLAPIQSLWDKQGLKKKTEYNITGV